MFQFGRHNQVQQELQQRLDANNQVIAAYEAIEGTRQNFITGDNDLGEKIHPWGAPDLVLYQMGLAATALVSARTAQILQEKGTITRENGRTDLPSDVGEFALDLSELADRCMDKAKGMLPSQDEIVFDQATCDTLNPESLLPYWPRTAWGRQREEWQGHNTPYVSTAFLNAIIDSAWDLGERYAAPAMDSLRDPEKIGLDMPDSLNAMPNVVGDILQRASHQLKHAESLLATVGEGHMSADMRHDIYTAAHGGFLDVMTATVAVSCPPVLGEEFAPRR